MEYSETYQKYKTARDLSWAVLIDNHLTRFPIDPYTLMQQYNITPLNMHKAPGTVQTYNISPNAEAVALQIKGEHFILFNPNTNRQRLRFTLMHELGHILLHHTADQNFFYNKYSESEANIFARSTLMPAIVCHVEHLLTPKRISAYFDVSLQAATYRAERMQILEARNKWLTSPLEKQYFNIFYL